MQLATCVLVVPSDKIQMTFGAKVKSDFLIFNHLVAKFTTVIINKAINLRNTIAKNNYLVTKKVQTTFAFWTLSHKRFGSQEMSFMLRNQISSKFLEFLLWNSHHMLLVVARSFSPNISQIRLAGTEIIKKQIQNSQEFQLESKRFKMKLGKTHRTKSTETKLSRWGAYELSLSNLRSKETHRNKSFCKIFSEILDVKMLECKERDQLQNEESGSASDSDSSDELNLNFAKHSSQYSTLLL
ncbi:hypothetical protein M231_05621 [Tremella mesenterica]|uniref:Uncharacterized protein n=1 Tax=Tremella mesenterica TaxID=5217 RepID=A0A4Q1BHL3_TREME|nr:hypothetical protein M231_05621 [Tremella mesenterica]